MQTKSRNVQDTFGKVNPKESQEGLEVSIGLSCKEAEIDEQWSFVQKKSNQRWIWHAVDHQTNTILAYVFGKRKDEVFKS